MLYSVAISDILFKLSELDVVYNDTEAHDLLEGIKNFNSAESKSKWEFQLIKAMMDKGYISNKLYSDLESLYRDRCFSAHPAMNDDFELLSPTKESSAAHIVNILNGLLIEPPMFKKNIVDRLTDDLRSRKDTFADDEILEKFLNKTYFSKLTEPAKIMLFKSLWNFCFNKPNDPDCMDNLILNLRALMILCKFNRNIIADAKRKDFKFKFSQDDQIMRALCLFMSQYDSFAYLEDNDKLLVQNFISDSPKYQFVSWFIDESIDTFVNRITVFINTRSLSIVLPFYVFKYFQQKMEALAMSELFLDICIKLFINCSNFYDVMELYTNYIRPNLKRFSIRQIENILEGIDNNYCIYKCWSFSVEDIIKTYKEKLGTTPNIIKYKNIVFPAEYLDVDSNN